MGHFTAMQTVDASFTLAYSGTIATIFLWSVFFPAGSTGVRQNDPLGLAAVRFALASGAVGWLALGPGRLPAIDNHGHVLVSGVLGIARYNALLNTDERAVSPGAAGFIVAPRTIFAAGLTHLVGQRNAGRQSIAGTILALFGVALIALEQTSSVHVGCGALLPIPMSGHVAEAFAALGGVAALAGVAIANRRHGRAPVMKWES